MNYMGTFCVPHLLRYQMQITLNCWSQLRWRYKHCISILSLRKGKRIKACECIGACCMFYLILLWCSRIPHFMWITGDIHYKLPIKLTSNPHLNAGCVVMNNLMKLQLQLHRGFCVDMMYIELFIRIPPSHADYKNSLITHSMDIHYPCASHFHNF